MVFGDVVAPQLGGTHSKVRSRSFLHVGARGAAVDDKKLAEETALVVNEDGGLRVVSVGSPETTLLDQIEAF